jgi:hypothetical protein
VTPFHHQPEAQHPKSFSYPQAAGRLPHLLAQSRHGLSHRVSIAPTSSEWTVWLLLDDVKRFDHNSTITRIRTLVRNVKDILGG